MLLFRLFGYSKGMMRLPEIVTPLFTIPRLPFYRMSELKANNLYRSNCLYFALALFTALAVSAVCHCLKRPRFFCCLILCMYALHFCRYYYSERITEENPIIWFTYNDLDSIYQYLHDGQITRDVYIDDYNLTTYCYAMLEYEVSPYDFEAAIDALGRSGLRSTHYGYYTLYH